MTEWQTSTNGIAPNGAFFNEVATQIINLK
jgi:hypothetical protein